MKSLPSWKCRVKSNMRKEKRKKEIILNSEMIYLKKHLTLGGGYMVKYTDIAT